MHARVAYPYVHVPLQERLAQLPGGLRHPELLSVWDQWSYFQHEDKIIFVDDAERFVRLGLPFARCLLAFRAFPCSEPSLALVLRILCSRSDRQRGLWRVARVCVLPRCGEGRPLHVT